MTIDEIRSEYTKTYDKGVLNHGVRFWFYLQRGLDLINQFKYLILGVVAVYYALKLEWIGWFVVLFVVSIPILIICGFFYTHKMAKALEWTNMVFSSYFARHNIDLAEKNVEYLSKNAELLEEIRDILKLNEKERHQREKVIR